MGNGARALLMAAGLFLTIALITIAVQMFGSGQQSATAAQSDFSTMQTELSSQSYLVFDNTTVTGSQVLNSIRKFNNKEAFGIQVVTGKNTANGQPGSWYKNTVSIAGGPGSANYGNVTKGGTGTIENATTESGTDYINPNGQFHGQILRDKNNVIRGIIFTQLP
ncbi:ABC transporter permease [Paenibacillus chitinolyticus]|uniref:ABC transporter permease n=1 Tax=Paenibacillus chitinolyticus TaxID=79263 RepID=UPI001C44A2C0|nr:ABC transporter permease [Paenibacillus chitinolyticus]MBV6717213.1 ABC transporter permease [Paenibacillus chitinolyticus]